MTSKLSKSEIAQIKKLSKSGKQAKVIAEKFGISSSTVLYWIHPKRRIRRRPEYMREYMRSRYNSDPAFRERQRERMRIYSRKNYKK